MSTLTSSPSPAASPRSSFHVQRNSYTNYPFTSSSPKLRGFNASPVQHPSGSASGAKAPRAHHAESPASEKAAHKYVHEGTQYSPDGYPPTARSALSGAANQEGAVSRKRKEQASPPSADLMNTSAASSASTIPSQPPAEPEPRLDPTPAATQSSTALAATARPQAEQDAGPQEARSTHGHSSTPKRPRGDAPPAKIMPLAYQNCNPKDLGVLVANMLMELIRLNDRIPLRDGRLTRFHSRAPPGISVSDYLQRLIHHATLSPPILLSMVFYIDLLCQKYQNFTINSLTVHRFLITAATVAAKGLSDSFWTNPTYAKIGGIPVTELATLELEFLEKVDWKIVPRPETLDEYYESLVTRTEGFQLEQVESSASTSVGESDDGDEQTDGDEMAVDETT